MSERENILRYYTRQLAAYESQLSRMAEHPVINVLGARAVRRRVQAVEEAQRDVLNTSVTDRISVSGVIDKNNYRTYDRQVEQAYKMYDNMTDYGGEVVGALVDIRVALIAGEGLSYYSDNPKRAAFVKRFLRETRLNGSRLLDAVLMTELEGRALFTLALDSAAKKRDPESAGLKVRNLSWWKTKYEVKRDEIDAEVIKEIAYKDKNGKVVQVNLDGAVYVRMGGSDCTNDKTPSKIGKCLTQCENASRAAYDLRANAHVFGKITPTWETKTDAAALAIKNQIDSKSFEIGDGYAGAALMKYLEPSGGAADVLIKDMLNNLRFVSTNTGVPIHWMAWPELMSNRATAENMLEVTSAATKRERLRLEEALGEVIDMACVMGTDAGAEKGSELLKGESQVRLPVVSIAALQQIIDIYLPLWQEKLISTFTVRNMIPGIDPQEEAKLVDEDREEAAERSPFNNETVDETLKKVKGEGEEAEGEGEEDEDAEDA